MKFLLNELVGKRPLMPPNLQTSAEQTDVINTFRVIAQLPPDSLGAYVISMARSASDVLAVVLLQVCSKPARCAHTLHAPINITCLPHVFSHRTSCFSVASSTSKPGSLAFLFAISPELHVPCYQHL